MAPDCRNRLGLACVAQSAERSSAASPPPPASPRGVSSSRGRVCVAHGIRSHHLGPHCVSTHGATVSCQRVGWFPAVLADVRAGRPGDAWARAHRGDPGGVRRGDTGDESVHVCALPSRAPARVGHQTVSRRAVGTITHAQGRRMAPQGPSILVEVLADQHCKCS